MTIGNSARLIGSVATILLFVGGLYAGLLAQRAKRTEPTPPPQIAIEPTTDCKVAQVQIQATSFGRASKPHRHTIPVLVWASYVNAKGQSVRIVNCPGTWAPPIWGISGDERAAFVVDQYPFSGELYGPPGTKVTLTAEDPKSGAQGNIDIELDDAPQPVVVRRPPKPLSADNPKWDTTTHPS